LRLSIGGSHRRLPPPETPSTGLIGSERRGGCSPRAPGSLPPACNFSRTRTTGRHVEGQVLSRGGTWHALTLRLRSLLLADVSFAQKRSTTRSPWSCIACLFISSNRVVGQCGSGAARHRSVGNAAAWCYGSVIGPPAAELPSIHSIIGLRNGVYPVLRTGAATAEDVANHWKKKVCAEKGFAMARRLRDISLSGLKGICGG